MKRILFSTLILLLAAGTVSAQKKDKKKKAKDSAKTEVVAPVAKPDTVSVDVFSYHLGIANINGLKPYLQRNLKIDTTLYMDDFVRGFEEFAKNPKDQKLKAYATGLQIAEQVLNQMLSATNKQITGDADSAFVNQSEFVRGFIAALTMKETNISLDSAMALATKQIEFYRSELMEKKYGENRRAGEAFLAENAKKDSVVTLPSGLQYKIIKAGTGEKPQANSKVEVNYEGRLIDGTVFDSSYKRNKPQEFGVGGVIPGFSEALQLMPAGSTWEIYIPQNLGYGDRENQNSPIKPFSALIFKVELLSVKEAPKPKIPAVNPVK